MSMYRDQCKDDVCHVNRVVTYNKYLVSYNHVMFDKCLINVFLEYIFRHNMNKSIFSTFYIAIYFILCL